MLGARDVVADGLAIQAGLGDSRGDDLKPSPGRAAGPAVGFLGSAELLHMRVEVGLGCRAGLAVPAAHAQHTLGAGGHDVAVELEGRAHRCIEELRVEGDLLALPAGQDGVGRVGQADEGIGVLVLHRTQHRAQVLDAQRVALVLDDADAAAGHGHFQRCVVLQAEEVVDVDHGHGFGAAGLEHVHQRIHHGFRLLQQEEEVGQLHLRQPPAECRGRQEGVAKAIRQRRDGEVGVAAPGRQDQIDLVAAHQLFVGAHAGFDVTAVVAADQLDGPFCAFDIEATGGVLLLGPQQVVGFLADLRAGGPRACAGHRIADTHGAGLGAQQTREGQCRRCGCGGLDDGAARQSAAVAGGLAHVVSGVGSWWGDCAKGVG